MKRIAGLAVWMMWFACASSTGQTVHAVAEENPKLHVSAPGGEVVGPGADLVREVLRRAELNYDMRIYPWSRAYAMALAQENVLIFSIGRSHEREHQFKWVGEIVEAKFRFYKLKSRADVSLKKLDDARKYSIGVTNQDITHQFLEHKEFAASKLDLASDSDRNIEKLLVGRMDVILSSISNIDAACEHDRTICDKLEPLMVVDELTTPMYMAFSAATSDAVVKRARKAYDAMRTDGTWTKIMSRVH